MNCSATFVYISLYFTQPLSPGHFYFLLLPLTKSHVNWDKKNKKNKNKKEKENKNKKKTKLGVYYIHREKNEMLYFIKWSIDELRSPTARGMKLSRSALHRHLTSLTSLMPGPCLPVMSWADSLWCWLVWLSNPQTVFILLVKKSKCEHWVEGSGYGILCPCIIQKGELFLLEP